MSTQTRFQVNRNQESIQQILSQIPKDMFIDVYRKYCPPVNDSTTARQVQQICYLHSLAMQLTAIVSADMHRIIIHQQLQNDARVTQTQHHRQNTFEQYEYRSKTQAANRVTDKQCIHAQERIKKLEFEGQIESKRQYLKINMRGSPECDTSSYHEGSNYQPTQASRRFDQYEYQGANRQAYKNQRNKSATKDKPFQKAFAQNQSKKTKLLGFELLQPVLQPVENQKNKITSTRQLFLQKERNRMFANQAPKVEKIRKESIEFQKTYRHPFYEEPSTLQELEQNISSRYQKHNSKRQKNISKEPKGKSKGKNQPKCYRCQKFMNVSNKQFKRHEGLCEDCRCQSNQIVSSRMNTNFSQQFGF